MSMKLHALIPAAGQSVRFGGTTIKQYAHLLGRPVLAHSIEALNHHPWVQSITVALAADDGIFAELVQPGFPQVQTIIGGASRAHSVLNGLQYLRSKAGEDDWVLVHDAARPCLEPKALQSLLDAAQSWGHGAILAVPVADTLKRATDDDRIETTLDRRGVWAAQTPQLFPLAELAEHLQSALRFGRPPTDEAEAMERCGKTVGLVMGSADNIKITRPADLALAEAILRRHRDTPERETGS